MTAAVEISCVPYEVRLSRGGAEGNIRTSTYAGLLEDSGSEGELREQVHMFNKRVHGCGDGFSWLKICAVDIDFGEAAFSYRWPESNGLSLTHAMELIEGRTIFPQLVEVLMDRLTSILGVFAKCRKPSCLILPSDIWLHIEDISHPIITPKSFRDAVCNPIPLQLLPEARRHLFWSPANTAYTSPDLLRLIHAEHKIPDTTTTAWDNWSLACVLLQAGVGTTPYQASRKLRELCFHGRSAAEWDFHRDCVTQFSEEQRRRWDAQSQKVRSFIESSLQVSRGESRKRTMAEVESAVDEQESASERHGSLLQQRSCLQTSLPLMIPVSAHEQSSLVDFSRDSLFDDAEGDVVPVAAPRSSSCERSATVVDLTGDEVEDDEGDDQMDVAFEQQLRVRPKSTQSVSGGQVHMSLSPQQQSNANGGMLSSRESAVQLSVPKVFYIKRDETLLNNFKILLRMFKKRGPWTTFNEFWDDLKIANNNWRVMYLFRIHREAFTKCPGLKLDGTKRVFEWYHYVVRPTGLLLLLCAQFRWLSELIRENVEIHHPFLSSLEELYEIERSSSEGERDIRLEQWVESSGGGFATPK